MISRRLTQLNHLRRCLQIYDMSYSLSSRSLPSMSVFLISCLLPSTSMNVFSALRTSVKSIVRPAFFQIQLIANVINLFACLNCLKSVWFPDNRFSFWLNRHTLLGDALSKCWICLHPKTVGRVYIFTLLPDSNSWSSVKLAEVEFPSSVICESQLIWLLVQTAHLTGERVNRKTWYYLKKKTFRIWERKDNSPAREESSLLERAYSETLLYRIWFCFDSP